MKLYNSYSDKIEAFQPLNSTNVKLYVCGITPYDTTHLGHAFVYVTFDALKRFLEFKGYKVTYTQNVTDIDDDILKRARRDNVDWIELGNSWTGKFLHDLKALNVEMPDHYIKATEAIPEIIEMVSVLIEKGFAYQKEGHVYFEVARFPDYGKLSKFSRHQMLMLQKDRGGDAADPNKKDPLDFLLWQPSGNDEPSWDSPWGKGRPGWHIECSAMIKKTLGDQIDIHGGGRDLIYPHHESEVAQSEAYSGKYPAVKYWMHAAMVNYMGEKMSKSLGNLILVANLLKKYSPNAIRLMLLLNHYRSPWEYTENKMEEAQKAMDRMDQRFKSVKPNPETSSLLVDELENDFNTEALLSRLLSEPNTNLEEAKTIFKILGFAI